MPGGNVGDFMRHDCGQLGFIIGREDQADVLHIGIFLFAFLLGFGFVLILILILGRRVGLVAVVVLGKQRHRNRDHECQEKHTPCSGNLMTHVVFSAGKLGSS